MNEDLELKREGGRFYLYDQASRTRYTLPDSLNIDPGLEGLYTEDCRIFRRSVEYFSIVDDDGDLVEYRVPRQEQPRTNQRRGRGQNTDRQRRRSGIDQNRQRRPALAPYNFVPLNDTVVRHDPAGTQSDFDSELYSGHIDIDLTTETPFFIRSEKFEQRFFSVGKGHPFVPGSSLRGMVRSLVEIISHSALGIFTDTQMSHRSLAEMAKRLNEAYKEQITYNCTTEEDLKEMKVGYLTFVEGKYIIHPAGFPKRFKETEEYQKAPDKLGSGYKVYSGHMNEKKHQWIIGAPRTQVQLEIEANAIKAYRDDATRNTYGNGQYKKHKYQLNILKEAKENKEPSKNKETKKNNEKEKEYWPNGYPVFYNTAPDNDQLVVSFGHTPFYRVPYRRSVGDHIPHELAEGEMDFATALFGSTECAGRVQFGDLDMVTAKEWDHPVRTRKLMTPKPTTFQHYLEQPKGTSTQLNDLLHWGDGTPASPVPVRGHKMYWHRKPPERAKKGEFWGATSDDLEKGAEMDKKSKSLKPDDWGTVQVPLIPVKPTSLFKGRIHFDNLSAVELGGLLTALELPGDCRHKMGLGKPLGLGTVKLQCTLKRVHRPQRYQRLWDESGTAWATGEKIIPLAERKALREAFARHLLDQLQHPGPDLWDIPRLAELKAMLHWDPDQAASPRWLAETRYMEMNRPQPTPFNPDRKQKKGDAWNEYKHRPVLPRPTDVREHFQQRPNPNPNHND